MRTFAKELIVLQPDADLAIITPALAALVDETRTAPIVFAPFKLLILAGRDSP